MMLHPISPKDPARELFVADAPYGNEYERNAPSRAPMVNSTTTVGSGTLHGGYGARGQADRPLSMVSDDDEMHYGHGRARELGV